MFTKVAVYWCPPIADSRRVLAKVCALTLKAPITTAADDNFHDIFPNFPPPPQKKKIYNEGMIFQENRLPAHDSHEISPLICYF